MSERKKELISVLINNQRAFTLYNNFKTKLCLDELGDREKAAFYLIPYFLHTGEPQELLGPLEGHHPLGVFAYTWSKNVQEFGAPHFLAKAKLDSRNPANHPMIEFVSLMGSIGSIAYTDKSDFDYWVCVRDDIKEEELKLLQDQIFLIEKWSKEKLKVEVHLFITCGKDLRDNRFGELSSESSGTLQGKLLKEEYFRGSLHIFGKVPYWWVTLAGSTDQQYQQMVKFIRVNKKEVHGDYIDIGNIDEIPREEFIGGALWQLDKGALSPFKSALKMALLISYTLSAKAPFLLSTQLKKQVQENPSAMEFLDPYQILIDRILNFYSEQKQPEMVKLLQICFFLKIGPSVLRWWDSPSPPQKNSDKVMLKYCREWGWNESDLDIWEHFESLPLKEALKFRKTLEHYMVKELSGLQEAEVKVGRGITKSDFKMIVRRLNVIYNHRRRHLDWFYPPFDRFIRARSFTLKAGSHEKYKTKWSLYCGQHDPKGKFGSLEKKSYVRSSRRLSTLVMWLIHNECILHGTYIASPLLENDIFLINLKKLALIYADHFGREKVCHIDNPAFGKQPVASKWILAINLYPGADRGTSPLLENQLFPKVRGARSKDGPLRPIFSQDSQSHLAKLTQDILGTESNPSKLLDELIPGSLDIENSGKGGSYRPDLSQEPEGQSVRMTPRLGSCLDKPKRLSATDDCLNAWENEISILSEICLIEKNSWGEVHVHEDSGPLWPLRIMIRIFSFCRENNLDPRSSIWVDVGRGKYDSIRLKRRFNYLLENAEEFFFPIEQKKTAPEKVQNTKQIYMFKFAGLVHVICESGSEFSGFSCNSYRQAMASLSLLPPKNHQIVYAQSPLQRDLLGSLSEFATEPGVNVIFFEEGDLTSVYLVDEFGLPLFLQVKTSEMRTFLPRFAYSVTTCAARSLCASPSSAFKNLKESIRYLWISRSKDKSLKSQDITADVHSMIRQAVPRLAYLEVHISCETALQFMSIYCQEGEFRLPDYESRESFIGLVESLRAIRQKSGVRDDQAYLTDLGITDEKSMALSTCGRLNIKLLYEEALTLSLHGKIQV